MTTPSLPRLFERGLRRLVSGARQLSPAAGVRRIKTDRQRSAFEAQLARLTAHGVVEPAAIGPGPVLVDGTFDNPNYWMRYGLLRAACGLASRQEVGLTGPWRRREAARTFQRLGISALADGRIDVAPFRAAAQALLAGTTDARAIMDWQLPEGLPGSILYDGLLKRQRAASVSLGHSHLVDHVAEALGELDFAARLVASRPWSLFALSHAINFRYGALAWTAARHGIPVVVCFGNYGTPRYWRVDSPADVFDSVDRPTGVVLDALPAARAGALAATGAEYLRHRLAGLTDDIGSIYAFQRNHQVVDRAAIASAMAWPLDRPIVTVYASNWFDFPHAAGMTQFRDFLDWMRVTLAAACAYDGASWLFRAHPCDQWYGGETLSDVMPTEAPPHVRLCPTAWHGAHVMAASDAVITVHGTAGIEAAMIGKPVMVADVGWYHDCGFTVWPKTAAAYAALAQSPWWRDVDTSTASSRAAAFAGIYFGAPAWQPPLVSGDDSEQAGLYQRLIAWLAERPPALASELETIAAWMASGERFYHTYKMRTTDCYTLTNVHD